MNAASRLPGRRPAVGRRQPHAREPWTAGALSPQALDHRRAGTRVKDASGAAAGGRAPPGPWPSSPARTNTAPARRKGSHGASSVCPANTVLPRNRRPKPRLTPARSFRD